MQETNNLTLLEKGKELTASPERLHKVWSDMNVEYAVQMDNGDLKSKIRLETEIRVLTFKLHAIYTLLNLLESNSLPEVAYMLTDMGFKIDLKNIKDSLKKANTKSKSILLQIKKLQADIKEDTKEYKSDWLGILIALSDHAKYPLITSNMTVMEYVKRYKNYSKYIEQTNNYGGKH